MRFFLVSYFLLLTLLGCSFFKSSQTKVPPAGVIRIGLQPTDGEKSLENLRIDLSKRLNIEVQFVISKDYSELVDLFKSKDLDFAFFTALNFLKAEREAGAKALLKKVYGSDEFYYSALVTLDGNGINRIKDIKGKRIGFVDPKSTSGYFYPRVMLRYENFDAGPGASAETNLEYEFFGTHEKALAGLMEGKVDFVGVWSSAPSMNEGAWTDARVQELNKSKRKFKVLLYSEPIPNDAFAVRSDFFETKPLVVYQVMEAFISAGEDPKGILKTSLNVERLVPATSRHYDSVRGLENLLKEIK
jgi:phosphonate transport system substrate-binding protein